MKKSIFKFLRFFISLFSERDDKGEFSYASLGRISFWITFGVAVYIWTMGTGDIQASHMQMLFIMATYNLMKKVQFFNGVVGPPETKKDESPRIKEN